MVNLGLVASSLSIVLYQVSLAVATYEDAGNKQQFHSKDHEKRGMKLEEYMEALDKRHEYLSLVATMQGREIKAEEIGYENQLSDQIFYTALQYEHLIESVKQRLSNNNKLGKFMHHREKRKVGLFTHQGGYVRQWALPIHYGINPNFTLTEKDIIRKAFDYYNENTVVQFKEIEYVPVSIPVLWIERARGCVSCVGMCGDNGGGILLSGACAQEIGGTLHEIAHSIGLLHEHQRQDRDDYLRLYPDNIVFPAGLEDPNFRTYSDLDSTTMGIPFDYGSLMIYQTWAGSKKPEWLPVMQPYDARYTRTIGQRVALSFFDIMAVNFMYGTACTSSKQCYNGGYLDPRDCGKCLCPEGLGGEDCREASRHSKGCSRKSETTIVRSTEEQCIWSRDYDSGGPYRIGDSCSYLLKTPPLCEGQIRVRFDGDFSVFCNQFGIDNQCFHWVEVKYKQDLSQRGIRLCCNRISSDMREVTSEGDAMVVHFDASYSIARNSYIAPGDRKGFKFCYRLEEECKERDPPTEAPQNDADSEADNDTEHPISASKATTSASGMPSTPLSTVTSPPSGYTTPDGIKQTNSNTPPGDNNQADYTLDGASTPSSKSTTNGDVPDGHISSGNTPNVTNPGSSTPSSDHVTARTVFPTRQFTPANKRYTACEDLCGCRFRQFVASFSVQRADFAVYCPHRLYFQYVPETATAYVGEMVCNGHLDRDTFFRYRYPAVKNCVMFCN